MSFTVRASFTGFRSWLALAAVLAAASVLSGCRSTPAKPAVTVTENTWAVVNDREITRDQVEKAYRRISDPSQPLSDEEALTAKLSLLNEVPDSELDAAFAARRQNLSEDAFQQELKRRQLSAADMRDGLRRELLAQKVVEREVTSKVGVTDQEVTDFFNANRARFYFPEEAYHIAQIAITPVREPQLANRSGNDATTPQAAAAKARMLMEKLKGGASFAELAMEYSEDPQTAQRGGDLGYVPVSKLQQAPPALRDAVLKVAPGTVNVVSQGGAHTLVAVVAHEPAGQRDLSTPAVKESITTALRGRKEQLMRTAYLTAVRTDAEVVNYLARRLVESQGKVPTMAPAAPAGR
jgi:peptidyl-prolyl cis-trans isomerase SurA